MTEIDEILARLEAAAEPAELLAAAWDAFSLLLAGCRDGEERCPEFFPAFAFAAAIAAEGRLVIDSALSLPAGYGAATSELICVDADPGSAADDLARLADALGVRLSRAAREARDGDDHQTYGQVAEKASQIRALLARDG